MDQDELRKKIMGFGENSLRKTYFPQYQQRLADLELFRTMIDSLADAIIIIDVKTNKIKDINTSACNLFQQTRDFCIQNTIQSIITTEEVLEFLRNTEGQKNYYIPHSLVVAPKACIPTEISISIENLSEGDFAVITYHDITNRVHTQEALAKSELRYRSLFNSSGESILIHDAETAEIIDANDTALEMLGYNLDELQDIGIIGISSGKGQSTPQQLPAIFAEIEKKGKHLFEWEIKTKNGKYFWSEINLRKSEIENKKCVLATIRDISQRKDDKIKLIKKTKEVEEQYKKLKLFNEQILRINEELDRARKKSQESDKLKSAFLANMSHEIRTPMNAILGFSRLLNDSETTDEERGHFTNIIQESSEQLLTIISDILDISKIEAGQLKIQRKAFNLHNCITDAISVIELERRKKKKNKINIIINDNCTEKDLTIISDKNRLKQILLNLLSNALKFTEEGKIEFSYKIHDQMILFCVEDTGTGISPEDHLLVFDRFAQVDFSFRRSHRGTGLGLAISKGLTTLLGGTIWVESELGEGSRFFFTIPNISPQHQPIPSSPSKKTIKEFNILSGRKVLIADDEPNNLAVLNNMLNKAGMTVLLAANGEEAVAIAKDTKDLDYILMDIQMNKLTGLEAAEQIRQFNTTIPIIAQTAFAMEGDRESLMKAGCNEYISKPIEKEQLFRILLKETH